MKFFTLALLATASAIKINSDPIPVTPTPVEKHDCTKEYFRAYQDGMEGDQAYKRVVPVHFNGEGDHDDRFMWNLYKNYALEGKTKDCKPSGKFWIDKRGAATVALEVLQNNVGMDLTKANKHLDEYFEKAWNHYDVNQTGLIEVTMMHTFMKFLSGEPFVVGLHAQKSNK